MGFVKGDPLLPCTVLALRRLIEEVKAKNLTSILIFVHFKKAFDSIHRGKMLDILRAYGVNSKIVKAIGIMYENTEAMVRSPDGDTTFFKIITGVLQGDTLAPYLFIICLDYALRISAERNNNLGFTIQERTCRRNPGTKIVDTDFADDIALLSDTMDSASQLLHVVEGAAIQIGLHINESKTEYMSYNGNGDGRILSSNGHKIKLVTDFQYLGSWLNTTKRDIDVRIAKAWSAHDKLKIIWKSDLDRVYKVELFRATVESIYSIQLRELDPNLTAHQKIGWNIHQVTSRCPK